MKNPQIKESKEQQDEHGMPSPEQRLMLLQDLVHILGSVVRRLQEEPFLFVIGVSALVVILVLGSITLVPDIGGPLYVGLVVIGVLALVALAAALMRVILETQEGHTEARRNHPAGREPEQGSTRQKGEIDVERQTSIADCESLKRRLEMARKTLDHLELQVAGYTSLTTPAYLQTDLDEKRRQVADLERELAECLQKGCMRDE